MKTQITITNGALLALLGLLFLAGCSTTPDTGSSPQRDRNSGFYGGVTGGGQP